MKIFIPEIGTKIKLLSPWNFDLYYEYRNRQLFNPCMEKVIESERAVLEKELALIKKTVDSEVALNKCWFTAAPSYPKYDEVNGKLNALNFWRGNNLRSFPFVFGKGTILTVDRIYIRKGASNFSSVTFRTRMKNDKGKERGVRFWVKLKDVNNIYCEVVEDKISV